jgi:colanic acid biosynthesis glycosyl transferase WcaI
LTAGRPFSQSDGVRVLLINQAFHPDPQATSQYLSRLAEELVKRGDEVTVLTGRRDYDDPRRLYPAREAWRGVEIIRVWSAGTGHQSKWRYGAKFVTFFLAASLRGFFLPRADLVLAQTSPPLVSVLGAFLAWLWRARFVYWVMDLNPDEAIAVGWLSAKSWAAHVMETASRWSLRAANHIIVQDKYVRQRLMAKDVSGERIEVIPLWIQDEAAFDAAKREEFRRKHGLEDKYVVMFAGNHTPCHPLATVVEAARLLRGEARIHFCFIGFGLEWGKLRDLAKEENWGHATFLGYQPLSTGVLSAADTQLVVMGDPFVGIVHACKIYNILAAQRPFIYIGPEPSHVTDIIRDGALESVAASFCHGESQALADELRRRMKEGPRPWPAGEPFAPWSEKAVLQRMVAALGQSLPPSKTT